MSRKGLVDHDKINKKSYRWVETAELDVFKATRCFSSYNENYSIYSDGPNLSQKILRGEERQGWLAGRVSLDLPMTHHHHRDHHHHHHRHDYTHLDITKQQATEDTKKSKFKQPSSPGGKLANFLNSLFNQAVLSKKKKSKSTTTQSMKDHIEEESPRGGWRRRRRSSISHFRHTNNSIESKPSYPSSTSGSRTPPPYVTTPTKSYSYLRSLSKYTINGKKKESTLDWLDDEKFKIGDKMKKGNEKVKDEVHDHEAKKMKEEQDEGEESDSSSDLFELQLDLYDLGSECYSSGLPVYETTHMECIKRSSTSLP